MIYSSDHVEYENVRTRIAYLAVATVVGFGFAAPQSWAAAEWRQSGNPLTQELSFSGDTTTRSQLREPNFTIECLSTKISGNVEKPDLMKEGRIEFQRCESSSEGFQCEVNSVGAMGGFQGEIISYPLLGKLGTVAGAEAASERGLEFSPEAKTPVFEIQGKCLPGGRGTTTITEKITGGIIAEISPKGNETAELKLKFEVAAGKQKVQKFTGLGALTLSAFGSESLLESSYVLRFYTRGCFRLAVEVN